MNEEDGEDAADGGVVKVLIEFSVELRIVETAIVVDAIEYLVSALANWGCKSVVLPIVPIDAERPSMNLGSFSSSESPRTNKLDSF